MPARPERARPLALILTATALLISACGLALLAVSWGAQTPPIWAFRGFPYAIGLTFAVVGYRVALRVPRNPIGWLGLGSAVVAAIQGASVDYATLALYTGRGLPGGEIAAWVNNWIWILGMGAFMLVLFVFPNGRPLARAWLAGAAVGLAGVLLVVAGAACAPTLVAAFGLPNPLSCGSLAAFALPTLGAGTILFAAALIAGAASLVVRYRRAAREERLQIKWVAASGVLVGFAFAIQVPAIEDKARQYLVAGAALTLPVAFGVAILRYRLYDIDALINRALVYGLLTAILAGLYTASIGFFQRLFVAVTGERSDAAVVLTTLLIAAAFTPLRTSLQGQVDRRLKPASDDQRRLAAFRERVRAVAELLEPPILRRRFLEESVAALGAVGGSLDVAAAPPGAHRVGEWAAPPAVIVDLREGDALVGRLALGPRRDGRPYRADEVRELEATAGVIAHAVGLTGSALTRPETAFPAERVLTAGERRVDPSSTADARRR